MNRESNLVKSNTIHSNRRRRISNAEHTIKHRKSMHDKSINPDDDEADQSGPKHNNYMEEEKEIKPHTQNKYPRVSYKPGYKEKLHAFLEHTVYKVLYVIMTIYVLFADDLKLALTDQNADLTFTIIAMFIMMFFTFEIIIYFIVFDEDYTCGVFFWIDLIGLASMVLDIHWVTNIVVQNVTNGDDIGVNDRIYGLNRLSHGVRIVTRAIRMIRIIKLLKLFKRKCTKNSEEDIDADPVDDHEESKVGQKLEDLTLKRVIFLILLLVIAVVLFNPNFYYQQKTFRDFGLQIFNDVNKGSRFLNFTFNIFVTESMNSDTPIIYMKAYNMYWGDYSKIDDFRLIEKIEVYDDCVWPRDNSTSQTSASNTTAISHNCYAVFDNKIPLKFASWMNIAKTLSICIVLGGGIICFAKDTHDLVLEPIAKMTKKIKNLSKNPIEAMQHNLNDHTEQPEEKGISVITKKAMACCMNQRKKTEAPLETTILEKTISKISTLLALGFGEAGAEIISTNMKVGDGDVNPMLSGKKVMAVYGFCDIRNFTDTTEILQEGVMLFVNQIAEIVHEITTKYCGSANKNIGDAFLLVWKFDEKFVERTENDIRLVKSKVTSQIVDMALIAFLKILAAVRKSYKLSEYSKNKALLDRIKNYTVKMGFGLHLGYSIEGAIGSMFKIDASYLSPNVNMASKLEEKTKEYKVMLILSDDFVDHLSEDAKRYVRLIDKVKSEAKSDGILIEPESNEKEFTSEEDLNNKMEKIKANREIRRQLYNDTLNGKTDVWKSFIETDSDWSDMRKKFTPEFYETYESALHHYFEGNWSQAKECFEMANSLVDYEDGPTAAFLHYMERKNYIPGDDWNGVKEEDHDGH